MSCYTKEELENMLQDVVNELGLDDHMIAKHGPRGTAPAVLVKEVLDEKNRIIGGERYVHKEQIDELKAELATLRAKAEAWDKGVEMWGVFDSHDSLIIVGGHKSHAKRRYCQAGYLITDKELDVLWEAEEAKGYTCRKVKVCEVVG